MEASSVDQVQPKKFLLGDTQEIRFIDDAGELGSLVWDGSKFTFEGYPAPSARIFLAELQRQWDARLASLEHLADAVRDARNAESEEEFAEAWRDMLVRLLVLDDEVDPLVTYHVERETPLPHIDEAAIP